MTAFNAEEAAQRAEATFTNVEGMCQQVTRNYYGAPSVGDFDGDGASDAEDGGKSEPLRFRHLDRKGKRGYPATFFGGRNDNGHRAIFIDDEGTIRSTDFNGLTNQYAAGILGNGTVEQIEDAMGVTYAFWSDTIDTVLITPAPVPVKPKGKGSKVQHAIDDLQDAKGNKGRRKSLIQKALDILKKI